MIYLYYSLNNFILNDLFVLLKLKQFYFSKVNFPLKKERKKKKEKLVKMIFLFSADLDLTLLTFVHILPNHLALNQ